MPTSRMKSLLVPCLTAGMIVFLSTGAHATPFVEAVGCVGGDAGNSFGTACDVPDGTTSISGEVDLQADTVDFYKFNNLVAGSEFEVEIVELSVFDQVMVYNQNEVFQFAFFQPVSAPNSFFLGAGETMVFIQVISQLDSPFSMNVNASFATPEPASAALLGIGALGMGVLRKRRKIRGRRE